jgi:hypothetical protein
MINSFFYILDYIYMPAYIRMHLNSGVLPPMVQQKLSDHEVKVQKILRRRSPMSLGSPMISRVQNVRPGCGGCGK